MKKQTLLFQGMGMDYYLPENWEHSDVGNFRIRTAFTAANGEKVFFECGNANRPKSNEYYLFINFLFNITDDPKIDDCNHSRINYDQSKLRDNYKYTKKDILKFVNDKFGTNFTDLQVNSLGSEGYRVGRNPKGYNLMENYLYN